MDSTDSPTYSSWPTLTSFDPIRSESMIAKSVKNVTIPPTETNKKAKYRKGAAIGMMRRYKKGKASLSWLQGMIADLRNRKGLTESEIKQVLRYTNCEDLGRVL